jgi:hypothetical protein
MRRPLKQIVLDALQQNSARNEVDTVEFYYPSGLLPANPDHPTGESNYSWAWGYGDHKLDRIKGLEESIQYILSLLERHGPFIGIMGFSTGAALTAIITSLLEKRKPVCHFQSEVRPVWQ